MYCVYHGPHCLRSGACALGDRFVTDRLEGGEGAGGGGDDDSGLGSEVVVAEGWP